MVSTISGTCYFLVHVVFLTVTLAGYLRSWPPPVFIQLSNLFLNDSCIVMICSCCHYFVSWNIVRSEKLWLLEHESEHTVWNMSLSTPSRTRVWAYHHFHVLSKVREPLAIWWSKSFYFQKNKSTVDLQWAALFAHVFHIPHIAQEVCMCTSHRSSQDKCIHLQGGRNHILCLSCMCLSHCHLLLELSPSCYVNHSTNTLPDPSPCSGSDGVERNIGTVAARGLAGLAPGPLSSLCLGYLVCCI